MRDATDDLKPYAGKPGRRHHNTPGDGTGYDVIRSMQPGELQEHDNAMGDAPPIDYPSMRKRSVGS